MFPSFGSFGAGAVELLQTLVNIYSCSDLFAESVHTDFTTAASSGPTELPGSERNLNTVLYEQSVLKQKRSLPPNNVFQ